MPIKLTDEQRAAVFCRNREMLVSAAAGSGKTRVIVERIMSRITGPEQKNINDFLVITFTNAAAAELRDRFEREISTRVSETPSDRHLKKQLSILSKAQITTIDAFCFSVIREFSHLCDLNPSVSIVEGAEADILRAEALENTLEHLYENMDYHPDFTELASLLSASRDDRILSGAISEAYIKIQSHPFPDTWMEDTLKSYDNCPDDFGSTVWGSFLLNEALSMAESGKQILESALDLLKDEPALESKYAPALRDDIEIAAKFISEASKGWDSAVEAASIPLTKLGAAPRDYFDPSFRDRIKSMREVWKKVYGSISESISESSSIHIDEIRRILPAIRGLFNAVKVYEEEYRRIKSARNLVDFNDVSHTVIRLLCRRSGDQTEPTEAAELIGSRYAEVLIDEFQDTNGIQTLIADMLTRGRNNLFMVGDVKQSIYRFRLAEPEIFLHRYKTYGDYSETAVNSAPVRTVLSRNFRSRPEVVGAVNSVFEKLMVGGFTQISYGERERLYAGRECVADGVKAARETGDITGGYLPEFLIVDVPKADDDEEDSVGKTETEAAYVARRIRSMLDLGFQIEEDGQMRRLRPGDIAILLRSASSKASYFERALSMNGIEAFTERSGPVRTAELLAMISILKVIDNTYQDIPLIGVMNSPVYSFTSDELAEVRSVDRSVSMYEAVIKSAEKGNEKCRELIESLSALRTYAYESGIDRLIRHIYSVTGLPGIYSAMADGAERRRNLMRLYEHAVSYESSGRHGIFGFVNYIEKTMENGTFGADETSGADAVRIMTIHKSKGMEFPVVFLCDLSSKFNLDDARKPVLIHPQTGVGLKILDHDRMYQYPTAVYTAISRKLREESLAEEMRILYVAMTRAKDKLIMTCALPDAPAKLQSILKNTDDIGLERIRSADGPAKWLVPLMALHPAGKKLREISGSSYFSPEDSGDWIIDVVTQELSSVAATDEQIDELSGNRVEAAEAATGSGEAGASRSAAEEAYAEESLSDIEELTEIINERLEYRYPFTLLSQVPSKLTATQLKGKAYESELTESAETISRPLTGLRRPRFVSGITGLTPTEKGTALHLAMQFIDLMKCRDTASIIKEIDRLREARILSGMQADAVDAEKILRFSESELGRRVFASQSIKREFKFSLLDDASRYYPDVPAGEKLLVQGVCDLYFEEDDGIVVVDFKSDRVSRQELTAKAGEYKPQVGLYAYALEKITGKKVKEKYLYFFAVDEAVRL